MNPVSLILISSVDTIISEYKKKVQNKSNVCSMLFICYLTTERNTFTFFNFHNIFYFCFYIYTHNNCWLIKKSTNVRFNTCTFLILLFAILFQKEYLLKSAGLQQTKILSEQRPPQTSTLKSKENFHSNYIFTSYLLVIFFAVLNAEFAAVLSL